jgi:para-aminobenzoate synthetase component II
VSAHVLVVDNYDSFVYNLVQYLGELGATVTVRRNDDITPADASAMGVDGVLVSPGPGHPRDAGQSENLIRWCADSGVPLLGVCLGHQALGNVLGATVNGAPELLHGESSLVDHDGTGVFRGLASPLVVGRYHSLVVDESTLPRELIVTARSRGLIMGMRHATLPLEGVQFHPESVLTQHGHVMLANWLATCGDDTAVAQAWALSERMETLRAGLPVAG